MNCLKIYGVEQSVSFNQKKNKNSDPIWLNSDEIYLFERVSSAYNTTIAAYNCGLLCVAHDNDVKSSHFNWKRIPITSAKFFIKVLKLIGHHFTELTAKE